MVDSKQRAKRTQITTVLDNTQGELMLTLVQGAESFSQPYNIDCQMYAPRSLNLKPVQLINTPATVKIRIEDLEDASDSQFRYQTRKGIFLTFAQQPRLHRFLGDQLLSGLNPDLYVYTGRLVPAFLMMSQEVRYRVFENMTVLEIIKEAMTRFQGLDLTNYISQASFDALANDDLNKVKLEHAIQYGESTFNFLSRLMNRSSIWYAFDHTGDGPFETMLIGKGPKSGFPSCTVYQNYVDPRSRHKLGSIRPWEIVYNPARTYTPSPKLVRVGEFNTVSPINPLQSTDGTKTNVAPEANIISMKDAKEQNVCSDQNEPITSFIQESFPDLGAFGDDDTLQDAQTALEIAEAQVEVLSGNSGNASFAAGSCFALIEGAEENLDPHNYLVTQMSYAAYDRNYLYLVRPNQALGLGGLLDSLLVQPFVAVLGGVDDTQGPDAAAALALSNTYAYVAQWQNYAAGNSVSFNSYNSRGGAGTALLNYTGTTIVNTAMAMAWFAGGWIPSVYNLLQYIVQLIESIIDGVLKVVATAVGVVFTVLMLPKFAVELITKHDTSIKKMWSAIFAAEKTVQDKLHPFFKPTYVDGYSSNFSATLVKRPGQRQGAGIPLPVNQKTQVFGPHLATVIGPTGLYQEDGQPAELYADKLGRVRIRFPWDRSPKGVDAVVSQLDGKPQFKFGEQTVWVRVSDSWAGMGYGSQFLPRVGDEVVVSFIDGDPDRPVITGRLYNPRMTGHSNLPFPQTGPLKSSSTGDDGAQNPNQITDMKELTSVATTQNFTQSGIKTCSTPNDAVKGPGFHLLRFDDKAGAEQLLLRSQGRLDVTALGTKYETLGGDRNLTVGGIDMKHQVVGGNYVSKVFQDYTLHVGDPAGPFNGGHRYEKVEQEYELTVVKDMNVKLQKNLTTEVTEAASLTASSIVLEATDKITLRVDGSWLVITPAGVFFDGPQHVIKSGGSPQDPNDMPLLHPIAGPAPADPGNPVAGTV